jgi:hypothetical protein
MELHENLYALGLRLGREVFEDPDTFRGALDDFLDEESATTGDINLLVDAVRLGAFSSMTSMLGSGAQVSAAVEEAGNRLARDRGSADVAGAQWACAVLGFAIGKVDDPEVRRYRTQHAIPQRSQQQPPTQFPDPPAPQAQQPGMAPTQRPGVPDHSGQPYPQTGPGVMPYRPATIPPPTPWQQGPPAKKRKTWPIVVGAAAAVAVIAGGVVAVIATQDDDDIRGGGGGGGEKSPTVTEVPVDLESVQERYSGLAADISAGLDECEAGGTDTGTSEVLECGFSNGTLTLTTFETIEDLESHRESNTGTDAGTRYSLTDAGAIYSVDSGSAVSSSGESSLYWDSSEALQSGTYVASSETVTADQLEEQYNSADGAVDYPTKPEDPAMIALATEFVKLRNCDRIATIQEGELEESICTAPNGIFVFMGVFETDEDFKDYRRSRLQEGKDQGYALRSWNFDGNTREGAAAEFINDSGEAVRYWDKAGCRCYMEANLDGGDIQALTDWWVNA